MLVRKGIDADRDRIVALNSQGFNTPHGILPRIREDLKPADWRIAEDDRGKIAAVLRTIPFGHHFGGRVVPATGIAGVTVSAEARGAGVGTALMREALREARAAGQPVSTLFPATSKIYRSVGYGYAFLWTEWKTPLASLPDGGGARVEEFGDEAVPELMEVYSGIASAQNGLILRDREWWNKRVMHPLWAEQEPYRYLVRQDGRITGWIVYSYESAKNDWRFSIEARDLFWTTPEAARALLSLASLHRSTARELNWVGPPSEPLADLLPEDEMKIHNRFRMMARLLDVPAAFEARGYAPHVETALSFAVEDALFPENSGPWLVQCAAGRAKVAPSNEADARADVGTWASIWSGLLSPRDAIRTGGLEATPDAIVALDAMFAGPAPWLADFY